ncbi:hypothetical protein [Aquihabitans sp. McL0605]|uniref:hypothetical protein n=1 Tax=Aquihabitans sp. McL0605 TaxID=3415671 RepID=UPI003CF9856C
MTAGSGRHRHIALFAERGSPLLAALDVGFPPARSSADTPVAAPELVVYGTTAQLLAAIASGRFTAAVLDAGTGRVDRDLLHTLAGAEVTTLVIDRRLPRRDWVALGASAVAGVPADHAALVDGVQQAPLGRPASPAHRAPFGALIAVIGGEGTARATTTAVLAQAWADRGEPVVLADLAVHAHQRVLHHVRDDHTGLMDLLEACRFGPPGSDLIDGTTVPVPARGYRLLPGLVRSSDWIAVRPAALAAALDGLRARGTTVVAEVGSDLEGEEATGSIDIADRNLLARTVVRAADAAVVVAMASPTGLHDLAALLGDLHDLHDTDTPRPVVVALVATPPRRQPRRRQRAITQVRDLLHGHSATCDPRGVLVLPSAHREEQHHPARRLPRRVGRFGRALAARITELDDAAQPRSPGRAAEPVPVVPGQLGHWLGPDGVDPA